MLLDLKYFFFLLTTWVVTLVLWSGSLESTELPITFNKTNPFLIFRIILHSWNPSSWFFHFLFTYLVFFLVIVSLALFIVLLIRRF